MVVLKDEVINEVIVKMQAELDSNQLSSLKSALIQVLYPLKIESETTEIATMEDDTEPYINKFRNTLRTEEKAESTIEQYVRATKKFFNYIHKNFRDIKGDDVLYYFAHLKRDTHTSASTRDNERKYIKSFFNWAFDNEYIYRNPFCKFKPIKRDEKKKVILSDHEIVKLRDESKNSLRDTALIDFLLATGVRVSEVHALNIDDVDFNTNEVSVYGIKTKKWRTVYLDPIASKHLKDYIDSRSDTNPALFVGNNRLYHRLSKATIEAITKKYGKLCGIKKKCTVHLFRKTLASKLYAQKMGMAEIAMILGHSIDVLQKYYLMIDTDSLKISYKHCIG